MPRTPLLLLCLLIPWLQESARAQQARPVLAIESAYDASPPPFLRTEMVRVRITGGVPHTPVSILTGQAIQPVPVPGLLGPLELHPATLSPLAGIDGFGLFGGTVPLHLNHLGQLSFVFPIPPGFAAPAPPALPHTVHVQALTRPVPFPDPAQPLGGPMYATTNAVALTVDEPATSPAITAVRVVDSSLQPLPPIVDEGSTPLAVISATGLLPEAGILPSVTIESLAVPGLASPAQVIALFDEDPSPSSTVPALLVRLPGSAGGILAPPATNAGQVRVRVTYGTDLYPLTPARGTGATSPPLPPSDPSYLLYRSALSPAVAAVSPRGLLWPPPAPCLPIAISGSGFLLGAQVSIGGLPVPAAHVAVTTSSGILVSEPPASLLPGLHGIEVRNIDEQVSQPAGGAALLGLFDQTPADVTITGASLTSLVEGTPGLTATLTGTCPVVSTVAGGVQEHLHFLDPGIGAATHRIAAVVGGIEVDLGTHPIPGILFPSPGTFQMVLPVPPYPPGLANLPAGSAGGLTNTGLKHWQIIPAPCVNPGLIPHRQPTPAAAEPANGLLYLAAQPPVFDEFDPCDHGRASGSQSVLLRGSGFLTSASSIASATAALNPRVLFLDEAGILAPIPAADVEFVDDTTLRIATPDVLGLATAFPYRTRLRIFNPDMQSTPGDIQSRFAFVPDLAPAVPFEFVPPAPGAALSLGTSPAGPAAWTFAGDLHLPGGSILRATGDYPLLIRVRGDLHVEGRIDLTGAVDGGNANAGAPPAGGAPGASALATGFSGAPGTQPAVPPLGPFGSGAPATGGSHGITGGGGGGAGLASSGWPGLPSSTHSPGGFPGQVLDGIPVPLPQSPHLPLPAVFLPPGGAGGAAGGAAADALPLSGSEPPGTVGPGGGGGHGGGSVIFIVEGHATLDGAIDVSGEPGGPGGPLGIRMGGGGGGGSGGTVTVVAIQGITVGPNASIVSAGGNGGSGYGGTVRFGGSGGDGSGGHIRLAIPEGALGARALDVDPGALVKPPPSTAGFPPSGL